MIFYTITDTLPVVPDWSSITGDLKAGTPISIKGAVSNDEAAIGLVAGDTAHGAEYAVVVTAGVVDLNAASASYGSTVSDDVVQALDNVTFIYGGKVYAVSGSSLPDYSQASDGDVLKISSGEPVWGSGGGGTEILYFYMQTPATFYHDPNDYEDTLTLAQVTAALADNPTAYAFLPMETPAAPAFGEVIMGHLVLNYFVDEATSLTLYNVDCDPSNPMGGITTPHTIAYAADSGGGGVEVGEP